MNLLLSAAAPERTHGGAAVGAALAVGVGLLLALAVVLALVLFRAHRRKLAGRLAPCPHCRRFIDRRAEVCPECGRPARGAGGPA